MGCVQGRALVQLSLLQPRRRVVLGHEVEGRLGNAGDQGARHDAGGPQHVHARGEEEPDIPAVAGDEADHAGQQHQVPGQMRCRHHDGLVARGMVVVCERREGVREPGLGRTRHHSPCTTSIKTAGTHTTQLERRGNCKRRDPVSADPVPFPRQRRRTMARNPLKKASVYAPGTAAATKEARVSENWSRTVGGHGA